LEAKEMSIHEVFEGLEQPPIRPVGQRPRSVSARPTNDEKARATTDVSENRAPAFSEIALADAFVANAILDFRWSPGLGWMMFDGTVWKRDDNLRRYSLVKDICTQASARAGNDGEARRISSAKTVQATLTLAQTDPQIVVASEVWDKDQMVLNTPGGIIDLKTGDKRFKGIEFVTQAARVSPDANASCPTWLRFLDAVFVGDKDLIEFMRRSMGYWLTGDRREQVLFFLHGSGSNGKSVLMDLLQWLYGSYALKLPAGVLMQSKFERHPTELAQLRGKRLAVSSELEEHASFNESLIKELTGDDKLAARFMRQDFFEFNMSQKHIVVGNFKPKLRGGDLAIARRMLLIPFAAKFEGEKRDLTLNDKLKGEAAGIMAWIVQGAVDWNQGGLAIPQSVHSASADYMADHDDLALWLGECCLLADKAKASDLYASFSRWKKARGENAPSQTVWGSRIATVAGIEKHRSNGIWYVGVALIEQETGFHSANTD
jgi:putative DNA primase/helicase